MPILASDIVFLESQVMDDVPEGGGAATGRVVVDGQMNNVFEDISDLDRAYGRFNMRKLFLGVRSLDTDLYGGVKLAVTELPEDPAVNYCLFSTGDQFDTRAQAQNRLESYLNSGPVWHGFLYENHIAGQESVRLFQRTETELPPIGKTLALSFAEGTPAHVEQYVRVLDVTSALRTFTDEKGDYQRLVVTLTISAPLRFNFPGATPNRFDTINYNQASRLRDTTVADAARYYGSVRSKAQASLGDLKIQASSLYAQLVPSSQSETPLVNQLMTPSLSPMVAAGERLSLSIPGAQISPSGRFVAPIGFLPGSLSVSIGGHTITDDGQGQALIGGVVRGQVVYVTGEVLFDATAPTASGPAGLSCIPATEVAQQAHTRALAVTPENRRKNWVERLSPSPQPGTLSVSFMAQNNWYVLHDTGKGALEGAAQGIGSGNLSYVTGDLSVELGATPDADTQILLVWASPVHYSQRAGSVDIDPMITLRIDLGEPVAPGSIALSWTSNSTSRSATADISGIISGDASGAVKHQAGEILLELYRLPDSGTSIRVQANRQASTMVIKTGVSAPGGIAVIDVGEAIEPGSLSAVWSTNATTKTDSAKIHFNYSWTNGIRIFPPGP